MMSLMGWVKTPFNELCSQDGISSPIAAHILDFCDDGSGGDLFAAVNAASDMFTASPDQDASSSSVTTPPAPCGHGDNVSLGAAAAAAASAFSPLPSLDSTLSALLEEDDPVPDTELLLPIDYQFAAAVAAGDEPQPEQQFAQVPVVLPVAGAAEHPGLQTQMSSTASELLHVASAGYTDECFAAAMAAAGGGYVGLDEALCQQQPQPGALLPAGMMEAAAQGCYFGKDAAAAQAGGFFGAAGCSGMMMSMMGMEEIGEYQRMMESASAALAATHSADADSAAAAQQMAFGGNAAGEMQMGGGGSMSPGRLPAAAATEASSLEDANFKSARITVEERREKIHRYIKKRNERNFSKKIKYACRKTLADSRPRVRGRFAKNDDYGEPSRVMQNHEEYDHMAGMKAEDILDPDALQAHLNGINSYMYSHTVESWM